jgi:hypothetical protein
MIRKVIDVGQPPTEGLSTPPDFQDWGKGILLTIYQLKILGAALQSFHTFLEHLFLVSDTNGKLQEWFGP